MAIKFLSGLNLSNVTAGSILKLDSNGNIVAAVDGTDYNTASSLWSTAGTGGVNINKDVRIGTFSSDVLPEARLHVYAYQTTDPKLLIEDGNTGDASMEFKISTQSYTMGIDNSDSDKFILAASSALGTTNVLEISTSGATAFQTDALFSADAYYSGSVGIGTLTPDSVVEISGTTDGTGSGADAILHVKQNGGWNANQPWALYVEGYSYLNGFRINAGDGIRALHKVDSGGQLGFSVTDTAPITFTQSNSTERMRVHTNGYIGIGTPSPEEKLHVIGNIKQNDYIIGRGAEHKVATMPDYYKIAQVTINGTYGTSHRIEGAVSYGGDNEKSTKINFWISFRSGGNLNVGTPLVRYGYKVENLNVASSNGFESGSVDTAFRISKTSDTSGGNKVYEIQFSPNDSNYINAQWELKYSDYGNQGRYPTTVYSTLQTVGTDISDSNISKSQDSTRVDNNTWITQLGVGSSNNTSYSLYNNNTSYFNGSVTIDDNLSMTGGGYITADSNNALVLRSDVQHGQGDEDAVIGFNQGTAELAKIDQDGYLYATGFKTSGTTGFLKSDGTVDTTTLGTMAAAATSDYKTSDQTETYVATELGSYTATTSFGTNAFTSFSDHSTQGYLTALPSHNHNDIYYTETELNGFFKSVTHQGNYISTANWSNDGSGSVNQGWGAEGYPFSPTGDFNQNGETAENIRTVAELPNGAYGVVWRTPSNDASSSSDGGWDMDIQNVQHAKAYRSVVYFQKTDDSTSGTFYHGCHGSHTLQMNGNPDTNPYFQTLGFSNLVENRWYVSVGYIQPYQYPTATNSTRSGIYDCYTGKKISNGTDYMMKSGSTTQRHRTYQYYSTDTSSSINWWSPRFEEINGNEPSLAELIQRVGVDGELGLNFHSKFPAGALDSLSETTDATNDKILLWDESADVWKQMTLEDLQDSIDTDTTNFAPLASPALTGTPTAPTAGATTNTTQLATTAFVQTAVSSLVDSAPSTLDTLNELAAALGDDASFSTTVTNSIATKLPLAGGTMTGSLTVEGDLNIGKDGTTPQVKLIYDDNHTNGDRWDTIIDIGRTQDRHSGDNEYPTYVTANGYSISFQSSSDGVLFGMENYSGSNYRPVIAWGDDNSDTPFNFRFNDGVVMSLGYNGVLTSTGNMVAGGNFKTTGNLDMREQNEENSTNVIYFNANNGNASNTSNDVGTGIVWKPLYTTYTKRSAGIMQMGEGNYFKSGLGFFTNNTSNATTDWSERMRISKEGNVGIGVTEPTVKLQVNGAVEAGGKTTYLKSYGSLDTTGNDVAGLIEGFNGGSALFTFTCYGDTGGYQKIVYSCYNTSGTTWNVEKVIDEGTNDFDITVDASGSTRTFTFVARSGTKAYSPRVIVEASGSSLDKQYL